MKTKLEDGVWQGHRDRVYKITRGQGEGTEDSHQARVEFIPGSRERCGKVIIELAKKAWKVCSSLPKSRVLGCRDALLCLRSASKVYGTAKEPSTCFLLDWTYTPNLFKRCSLRFWKGKTKQLYAYNLFFQLEIAIVSPLQYFQWNGPGFQQTHFIGISRD